jgi:hypothetical protein
VRDKIQQAKIELSKMLRYLFDRSRRIAAREFEVALYFLLHDSEKLIPFLKKAYRKEWPGFIEDILKGGS